MSANANLQIRVENMGTNAAKTELDKLAVAGANAERATDNLTNSVKKIPKEGKAASDSMKRMRHVAGGLGYQFQDVAVQAQMGTDGMIIFGQQGSQMASLFGPSGQVIGALIAIGAALIGAGMKAGGTKKELKELEENALQLSDAFTISSSGTLAYNERLQRLAKTAPEVAEALFKIKIRQLELEQTLAKGALKEGLSDFEDLTSLLETRTKQSFEDSKTSAFFLKSTLAELKDEFGGTNQQVVAVSRALADFNKEGNKDTASSLVDTLSALEGGSLKANKNVTKLISLLGQFVETSAVLANSDDPYEAPNKSIKSMIESLKLEAETLAMTNRERDLYIATQAKASDGQFLAINDAYDDIEAQRSQTAIERLESQLLSEEEKIDESYMRRREIIMNNTIEGGEQQNELLQENWDKYESEYTAHDDRLFAKDLASAKKREQLEAKVSKGIIRQKEGVVNSGIALLKNLTAGNENAAKAMVAIEAAHNIARTYQNTAAASMSAMVIDPTGVMSAKVWAYGGIQIGIIAANAALGMGSSGGGGGAESISSNTDSSPSSIQSPIQATNSASEESSKAPSYHFYGDFHGLEMDTFVDKFAEYVEEVDHAFFNKVG